jgi:hypothetical protein
MTARPCTGCRHHVPTLFLCREFDGWAKQRCASFEPADADAGEMADRIDADADRSWVAS